MGALLERIVGATASLPPRENRPGMGLILGSGLGAVADSLQIEESIPYTEISGMVASTAESHQGALLFGRYGDIPVVACQGRVHLYEGYSPVDVAMPVYLMAALGVTTLIVTNAAGGLNPDYEPGDLVIIRDHINMTGQNPLIGVDEPELGVRFPDMSRAYDPELRALAVARAGGLLPAKREQGVYVGVSGPSLETSAERRFYRQAGGDLIGMSTVMEVIAANHCGMKVLGLSVVTNKATGGDDQQPDTIEEVLAYAKTGGEKIKTLLDGLLPRV